MSVKQGRDYLLLLWQDEYSRKFFVVGTLSKNGQYEFEYSDEIDEAIKSGFQLLIPFGEKRKKYTSDILFPVFSSRLPEKNRRGIEMILKKYELSEYDEFKLLKRSGAKLPIDSLSFADPLFDDTDKSPYRIFYVAGPRHYIGCKGESCVKSFEIKPGQVLELYPEPTNQYDSNAIKLLLNKDVVGYVPRYYCASILSMIKKGYSCECIVMEVSKKSCCSECIKVRLQLLSK